MHTTIRRYDASATMGLPKDGKYIAISNSGVGQLACARKFMFSQVEHLGGKSTRAMDLGSAWDLIAQDVFTWWQLRDTQYPDAGLERCPHCSIGRNATPAPSFSGGLFVVVQAAPCPYCGGTGQPAIRRAMDLFSEQVHGTRWEAPTMGEEEYEKIEDTLRRMLQGYLYKWQRGPLDTIRILGTQVSLARAIVNPATGKPFRAATWLERPRTGGEWRTAVVGAKRRERDGMSELKRVTWPWLQVGLLDVLGADRQTGAAWVIDVKASGQPSRYANGMDVDPQLPGYCWLLQPHLRAFGLTGVAGFMYDVTHSKFQPDPHELKWAPPKMDDLRAMADAQGIKVAGRKSEDYLNALGIQPGHGGFSQSQNAGVPSWRYEWALDRDGVDAGPYQDHLQWIFENVDGGLYTRPWQKFGPDHVGRYARELHAKAAQMALLRRGGVTIEQPQEVDSIFPRTPVCMTPGASCAYSGPCAQDGAESRREYAVNPAQQWGEQPMVADSRATDPRDTEIDW